MVCVYYKGIKNSRGQKGVKLKKGVRQEEDRHIPQLKCTCEEFMDTQKRCAHCAFRFHDPREQVQCPKTGHFVHIECIVYY